MNTTHPLKTSLLIAMLCGFAIGCNESSSPDVEADRTTVTANRPVDTNAANNRDAAVDRSNTGINARDADGAEKTPFDQNENQADINITAEIRKQVVDTEMSTLAHNVKIITQDGKVTIRGPVETEQEKQSIEEIAQKVAGNDNVTSQLEVDAN
ncbi:MAG: BON domain-containing protein [Planctomycetaceae bacterium]